MNIITVDCGASFLKGALIAKGRICRKMKLQAPPVPIGRDVFSTDWIDRLLILVRRIILELGSGEREAYLCISNEMHGFLLAYMDGSRLTDYISWQKELGALDLDGQSALSILGSRELEKEIGRTGMSLRKGLPSCNLLYLYRKGALGKGRKNIYFYTLGDYILRNLSGKNPVCHPTNAAASGLYDIETQTWNTELLEAVCGGRISFLSVGRGYDELDFQLGHMILHAFPAIGDQQAALLGGGLADEDTMSFNLGTGAQVSMLTNALVLSKQYQTRPYFCGKYIKTVPHIPSGRALNVYFRFVRDLLGRFQMEASDHEIWKVLMHRETCQNTDGSGLECDLSFFDNAVTGHRTGSICNIGEYDFTIENVMDAVKSRMAENVILCAERLEPRPENISHLIFSGGIARRLDDVRNQIIRNYPKADRCELAEDETLIGLHRYFEMLLDKK